MDNHTIYESSVKQIAALQQQIAGLVAERDILATRIMNLQRVLERAEIEQEIWCKRALMAEARLGALAGVFPGLDDDAAPEDIDG
jgi:cell division protein FtsB